MSRRQPNPIRNGSGWHPLNHPTVTRSAPPPRRPDITDLASFGTNQIELAHVPSTCADDTSADCGLPIEALVNFSIAVDRLGLNTSLWWPMSLCGLANANATFGRMPALHSLLIEGGLDAKDSWAVGARCAAGLRRHHPEAAIWVASGAQNASGADAFFAAIEAHGRSPDGYLR